MSGHAFSQSANRLPTLQHPPLQVLDTDVVYERIVASGKNILPEEDGDPTGLLVRLIIE